MEFPPLPDGRTVRWTGTSWEASDGETLNFLPYSKRFDGWSDDLTLMHEDISGSLHPIDIASRDRALQAVRKYCGSTSQILEIGSSSGFLLGDLVAAFPQGTIIGSDVVSVGLEKMHVVQPTVPLLQLDITECPLPSSSFDAVIALNVLEHIQDDGKAVSEIARILKPGGVFIIEVPGGQGLYDGYDTFLHHFRRYSGPALTGIVKKAGLRIRERSALGFLVYPAFWIAKKLSILRHGKTADRNRVVRQIASTHKSTAMQIAFSLEKTLAGIFPLPAGIRITMVAEKP